MESKSLDFEGWVKAGRQAPVGSKYPMIHDDKSTVYVYIYIYRTSPVMSSSSKFQIIKVTVHILGHRSVSSLHLLKFWG